MKKKILFGALLCAGVLTTKAQWSLTGNAGINTATNFLGTTDNKALIFRTNNIERMRIGGAGKIGIGTTTPGTRFQINVATNQSPFSSWVNGLPTLYADSTGGLSVGGGVSAPVNGLYVVGNTGIGTSFQNAKLHVNAAAAQTVFRAQSNFATKLLVSSNGGVSVGSPSLAPADGLYVNGSTGIGTTLPATKLHVSGGTDLGLSGGGFITSGDISGLNIAIDNNEIMSRNNGLAASLTINNSGGNVIINGAGAAAASKLGIGTSSPLRDFEVEHASSSGASFGLMISNTDINNEDWTFYTENASGDLLLYENGNFTGRFSDVNGAYTTVSDRKLKQDFETAPSVLQAVKQLDVLKYNFVNKTSAHKYYGLIAQDVEKIFPELVEHVAGDDGKENYTMDYSGFGVLAIKAIQEQQAMIDELKSTIEELKSMVKNGSSSSASAVAAIPEGVRLEQNSPNPFSNATTIRYTIPSTVSTAQMIISNSNGTVVKTVSSLSKGNGTVTINSNELTAGTYYYSLLIDGKKADTKKMILVK